MNWHKITTNPRKTGLYLVFAPRAEYKCPLRHVAWWDGKQWSGIVDKWIDSVTHWMEFPPDPK